MSGRRTRVLITAEGTYPYYPGGVSVWCDQLIQKLPELDYSVFSITHSPSQPLRFTLPKNVVRCTPLPLWGTEEPGWCTGDFVNRYNRRLATTAEILETGFAVPFQSVVRELLSGAEANEQRLAQGLHQLYRFFQQYDYAAAMESELAWRLFVISVIRELPPAEEPSVEEVTAWMRWLTRYLAVVSVPLPEVDLVHSSFAGLAGVPGVLAKLEMGSAYLLSEHGIFLRELYLALSRSRETEKNRRFLMNLNRALVKMNYFFADTITSLGTFNQMWQLRFGAPAERIVYLPNGVDPDSFVPAPGKRPERPTVVTMARISPIKGIDTLMRAAATVKRRVPSVKFRVCGDVADENYYKAVLKIIEENSLKDSVEFGVTKDVVGAYQQAHVFCLPSNTEGMPYSILEAMLCGCPVVGTDVGNVAETIGGTGLVVRPNDPEKLAEALLYLLDTVDGARRRTQMSELARHRALTHYTLDQMANRTRALYGQLLSRSARQRSACTTSPQFA